MPLPTLVIIRPFQPFPSAVRGTQTLSTREITQLILQSAMFPNEPIWESVITSWWSIDKAMCNVLFVFFLLELHTSLSLSVCLYWLMATHVYEPCLCLWVSGRWAEGGNKTCSKDCGVQVDQSFRLQGVLLWNSQRDRGTWVLSSCFLTLVLNPSSFWSKPGPAERRKLPTDEGKCYRGPEWRKRIVRGLAAKWLTQIYREIIKCT